MMMDDERKDVDSVCGAQCWQCVGVLQYETLQDSELRVGILCAIGFLVIARVNTFSSLSQESAVACLCYSGRADFPLYLQRAISWIVEHTVIYYIHINSAVTKPPREPEIKRSPTNVNI